MTTNPNDPIKFSVPRSPAFIGSIATTNEPCQPKVPIVLGDEDPLNDVKINFRTVAKIGDRTANHLITNPLQGLINIPCIPGYQDIIVVSKDKTRVFVNYSRIARVGSLTAPKGGKVLPQENGPSNVRIS